MRTALFQAVRDREEKPSEVSGKQLGKDAGVKGQLVSDNAEVKSWGKQSGRMLLDGVLGVYVCGRSLGRNLKAFALVR